MLFLKRLLRKSKLISYWYFCYKYRKTPGSYDSIPNERIRKDFFHLESFGEKNPNTTFYLIEIEADTMGFFAILRNAISSLYVCERMGFTPYITVNKSHYDTKDGDNIFNNYFEQPASYSLEEIRQSKNVVGYCRDHMRLMEELNESQEMLLNGYTPDDRYINEASVICRKYIRIKEPVLSKIETDIAAVIKNKKTGGLHFRGNAFNCGLRGHPVALTIEEYFEPIDQCIQSGFEQVFVATDEMDVVEKLKSRYGEKLVCYADTFRSSNGLDTHEQTNDRENNHFLLGYEVLRDMLTLVASDALVCGRSQVSIAARIFKKAGGNEYERLTIIDNGIYAQEDKKTAEAYRARVNGN